MEVRMADHLGMCFGVRDAIALALELTQERSLTILGDLVHNPDVVAQLDAAGARRARNLEQVQTTDVLVTAHGTSDRMRLELAEQGLTVHDATCPLVRRAHVALLRLVEEGRFPVVIGQRDHVEVRGLVGDVDEHAVVLSEEDLEQLAGRDRLGVVAQTTQPLQRVQRLVTEMRRRLPKADIRFIDTVCQPTKDRQEALEQLAATTDVVVVVGGPESNNSRKLTELARRLGRPAYQVASAAELRREWFSDARIVGLTAGTSTPDRVIDEVRAWLEDLEQEPAAPEPAAGSPLAVGS